MQYSSEKFSERLEQLRIYRGYKSGAALCRALGSIRQLWSNWMAQSNLPSLNNLLQLANTMQIDIRYFFSEGATPQKYDLLCPLQDDGGTFPGPVTALFRLLLGSKEENRLLAIDNRNYPDISRLLERMADEYGCLFIDAPRYQPSLIERSRETVVLFADCEEFPRSILQEILYHQYTKMEHSFLFCGRYIGEILSEYHLLDMFDEVIYLYRYAMPDFAAVVTSFVGEFSSTAVS